MSTRPLVEHATVALGATGGGTATIGPRLSYEAWNVDELSVETTTSVKVPTVRVYRGTPSTATYLCGSYTGHRDTASGLGIVLAAGELLYVVWENGDVGAIARVILRGQQDTRRA